MILRVPHVLEGDLFLGRASLLQGERLQRSPSYTIYIQAIDSHAILSTMIETDNAKVTTATQTSTYKRITPAQRSAIVAEYASGKTIGQVAQQFGVHRNSVSVMVNNVRKQANSPALATHAVQTKALAQLISDEAKLAVQRSVQDLVDVHKAAGTGLSWLKGTGELNGDGTTVNVFVGAIRELPADLRGEYLSIDEDIVDVNATAVESTPQPVDE